MEGGGARFAERVVRASGSRSRAGGLACTCVRLFWFFFRWLIFAGLCSVVYFRSSQLITTGGCAGAGLHLRGFFGFPRLGGRWEVIPKKYQNRPG